MIADGMNNEKIEHEEIDTKKEFENNFVRYNAVAIDEHGNFIKSSDLDYQMTMNHLNYF